MPGIGHSLSPWMFSLLLYIVLRQYALSSLLFDDLTPSETSSSLLPCHRPSRTPHGTLLAQLYKFCLNSSSKLGALFKRNLWRTSSNPYFSILVVSLFSSQISFFTMYDSFLQIQVQASERREFIEWSQWICTFSPRLICLRISFSHRLSFGHTRAGFDSHYFASSRWFIRAAGFSDRLWRLLLCRGRDECKFGKGSPFTSLFIFIWKFSLQLAIGDEIRSFENGSAISLIHAPSNW